MARPEVIYRHSRAVRVTHWVNALVLLVLLMSGLQIFNAHPALYLGEKSDFDKPILAMRPMTHDRQIYGVTTVFGWDFDTTGLFGLGGDAETGYQERGVPWWATLPGHQDLSMGRRWHFFFAWLFLFQRADLSAVEPGERPFAAQPGAVRPGAQAYRRLDPGTTYSFKFPKGDEAKRYNVLQKLSLSDGRPGAAAADAADRIAMSPGMDAAFPVLLDIFGGRQSAAAPFISSRRASS